MATSDRRIFLSPPWTGEEERAALAAAFDSGYVAPCGPCVDAFERDLGLISGGLHVAALSGGTAALDLLMAELDVGEGDVVIASSLTFVATIGPAVHRGAEPVFVDADPATGTMDVALLVEALNAVSSEGKHIACVIAADLYGQCCDYDAIESVCARAGVPLIVDAAEAVGAFWKERPAGSAGMASVYSFNGNKIITTSGGGALLSKDADLVARARWRSQQAREPVQWYEHREVGYNYRLSNLLGALGSAQLKKLPEIIGRKTATFNAYSDFLSGSGVIPFPCSGLCRPTHWLSVFLWPDGKSRDAVIDRLTKANIECRPVWKPLHLQPVFRGRRFFGGGVCEDFFNRGICLPSGAGLTEGDLARVLECLK